MDSFTTTNPKLVTIFGITGNQGSSVATSLLGNQAQQFHVRGLTRNPSSAKAQELTKLGAELITIDAMTASVEDLAGAMKGSWGFFGNVNGDDETLESELDLGKKLVDAAAKANVKHFVYSGMESAAKLTGGKIPVRAFDDKNAIILHAQAQSFLSTHSVSPGWYMENFLVPSLADIFGGFPYTTTTATTTTTTTTTTPSASGELIFTCPSWGGNEEVPFISITNDYGDIVHGVFLSIILSSLTTFPTLPDGNIIQATSTSLTMPAVLSSFETFTGRKARFVTMSVEELDKFDGIPAMETVKGMFRFCQHTNGLYYGKANDGTLAKELKRMAVIARGGNGDAEEGRLMGFERFWKQWFGDGRNGWMGGESV